MPKSVGAKARAEREKLPDGRYGKIKENTSLTKVVTFAGKGTKKPIRVAKFLSEQYGNISESEWKKVRGEGTVVLTDNSERRAELHWFESEKTGRIKMKVKRWFD